jgi:catechol 2,3-dioxygenase-like lactoylglutathione lyase family enzyme
MELDGCKKIYCAGKRWKEIWMIRSVSHIALFVPDLQEAEQYYQNLFTMELIGREILHENGQSATLPFDKGWEDAKAAGLKIGMSALKKGKLVLALFSGKKSLGQVFAIGLNATQDEMDNIYRKLSPETQIDVHQADRLEFIDHFHITWQIAVDPVFRTAGDYANRWVDI